MKWALIIAVAAGAGLAENNPDGRSTSSEATAVVGECLSANAGDVEDRLDACVEADRVSGGWDPLALNGEELDIRIATIGDSWVRNTLTSDRTLRRHGDEAYREEFGIEAPNKEHARIMGRMIIAEADLAHSAEREPEKERRAGAILQAVRHRMCFAYERGLMEMTSQAGGNVRSVGEQGIEWSVEGCIQEETLGKASKQLAALQRDGKGMRE